MFHIKSYLLHVLVLTSFHSGVSGGISREEFIDSVAKDIITRIPALYDITKKSKTYQMQITPTLIVLLQELKRFNVLLKRMMKTLTLLRKALAVEIGMGPVLDNVAYSLFNGQLPAVWRKLIPATCKTFWGLDGALLQQASAIHNLAHKLLHFLAASGEPLVMWLSGLHIPESYLTALVQMACRRNGWPLYRSTLYTIVSEYTDPEDIEMHPLQISITPKMTTKSFYGTVVLSPTIGVEIKAYEDEQTNCTCQANREKIVIFNAVRAGTH